MNFYQLLTTSQYHLGHLLQALLKLSKDLFGVAVGAILNRYSVVTSALYQRFTLLLRLLTKLKRIVMNPLRFRLRLFLKFDPVSYTHLTLPTKA